MSTGAITLPVAIISNNEQRGHKLKELLHASGVEAILYTGLQGDILAQIDENPAAVIVDLDGGGERERRIIHELISQDAIPVLFNDGTCLEGHAPSLESQVGRQIAGKVVTFFEWGLAGGRHDGDGRAAANPVEAAAVETAPVVHAAPGETTTPRVWVLGASLGGPEAVRRFISGIPTDLPLAFILVQHIRAEHIALLQHQFRRATSWRIIVAQSGQLPQAGQLIIAPPDRVLGFGDDGRIRLTAAIPGEDTPCAIDIVLAAAANRYGSHAGAVIFSGIGNDGVLGAREILEHGGTVWAQSAASCVISSMPDYVRNACQIEFSGTPEELALELVRRFEWLRPPRRPAVDYPGPVSDIRVG